MSKINIRNIIKSDYMSVYNLIKNSLGYDNNITDLSARLDRLADNGYITLVAEINGVVIVGKIMAVVLMMICKKYTIIFKPVIILLLLHLYIFQNWQENSLM